MSNKKQKPPSKDYKVDAVYPILCKDCIELNRFERCDDLLSGTVRFYCPYAKGFVPLNHFCSYAERRVQDGK